jgi:hypothetical protein
MAFGCTQQLVLGAIDLPPVGYARNDHDATRVVNRVDDPVIANANSEVIRAGELGSPRRPWINGETIYRGCNSSLH